jgi:hypothetical protein
MNGIVRSLCFKDIPVLREIFNSFISGETSEEDGVLYSNKFSRSDYFINKFFFLNITGGIIYGFMI